MALASYPGSSPCRKNGEESEYEAKAIFLHGEEPGYEAKAIFYMGRSLEYEAKAIFTWGGAWVRGLLREAISSCVSKALTMLPSVVIAHCERERGK